MRTYSVQQLAESLALTDILIGMFESIEPKDPRIADALGAVLEQRAAFPEWAFHRDDAPLRAGGFDFGEAFEVQGRYRCFARMVFPTDLPTLVREVEICSSPAIDVMVRVGVYPKFSASGRGPKVERCWTVVPPRSDLVVEFDVEPGRYQIDDVIVRAHVLGKQHDRTVQAFR